METRGESLLKGFNNFVTDFQAGDVQMARPTDFTVGKDLGNHAGQSRVPQPLAGGDLHYTPTREKVIRDAHRDRHALDQQVLHARPQCRRRAW
jgi:polyhydroxyalkanoate synthase